MSNVLTLLGRRAAMMRKNDGGLLPSGYTQYDWVEADDSTTGSPIIDTQMAIPNSQNRWQFEGAFAKCGTPSSSGRSVIFTNTNETYDSGYCIIKYDSATSICYSYYGYYGGRKKVDITMTDGKWHTFLLTHHDDTSVGGKLIFDETTYEYTTTSAGNTTNKVLYLLGFPSHKTYPCRLARFKIYDYGVLAADMVPAKRDSDGVVGFYDVVRDLFLTPSVEGVTLLCGYGFEDFTV